LITLLICACGGPFTIKDERFKASDDPLQFKVDRDKGYYYIGGKGTVTTPKGKIIKLP